MSLKDLAEKTRNFMRRHGNAVGMGTAAAGITVAAGYYFLTRDAETPQMIQLQADLNNLYDVFWQAKTGTKAVLDASIETLTSRLDLLKEAVSSVTVKPGDSVWRMVERTYQEYHATGPGNLKEIVNQACIDNGFRPMDGIPADRLLEPVYNWRGEQVNCNLIKPGQHLDFTAAVSDKIEGLETAIQEKKSALEAASEALRHHAQVIGSNIAGSEWRQENKAVDGAVLTFTAMGSAGAALGWLSDYFTRRQKFDYFPTPPEPDGGEPAPVKVPEEPSLPSRVRGWAERALSSAGQYVTRTLSSLVDENDYLITRNVLPEAESQDFEDIMAAPNVISDFYMRKFDDLDNTANRVRARGRGERIEELYGYLREGPITAKEAAERIGVSTSTAYSYMNELRDLMDDTSLGFGKQTIDSKVIELPRRDPVSYQLAA